MDFGGHFIPQSHIIYETEYTFVFPNICPFLPNHILVSPKRPVLSLLDLSPEEASDMFLVIQLMTKSLKGICDGFTINIQDGKCAGQTVFHLHAHIVPRKYNDIPINEKIYEEGALQYNKRPTLSNDEMVELANYLKNFIIKTN